MNQVLEESEEKQACILVVDDNEMNRDLLSRRLSRDGYQVYVAEDGEIALTWLHDTLVDLVLLDIMMPGIDGYEVLERMKADKRLRHIPVIMISAINDMDSIIRCIEKGADDYLTKPFDPVLLKARVSSCLYKKYAHDKEVAYQKELSYFNEHLQEKVREQVNDITSAQLSTIFATSKLAESKDPETGAHLDRMREYCKILAIELAATAIYGSQINSQFIEVIYAASPLHDIGKVGIPDNILLKPGKLDSEEWVVMKTHAVIGADTLRAVDVKHPGNEFICMGIEISQCHHEKWDGSGYPDGLSGIHIPLSARILALADVYDALTSARCYKIAFSHEKSRAIILEGEASHFDPVVVKAFVSVEEEFKKVRSMFNDES